MNTRQAMELFLQSQDGIISPKTIEYYRHSLTRLSDFVGDKPVEEVDIRDLRAWRSELVNKKSCYGGGSSHPEEIRPLSPFSIHGIIKAGKRLFNWLRLEGIIEDNPALRLENVQLPDMPRKGIKKTDLEKLIAWADRTDPREYALVLFMADTAARVGGVAGLLLSDLDIEGRKATVREKGLAGHGRSRTVFFTDRTARALEKWLDLREYFVRPGVEEVFISYGPKSSNGRSLDTKGIYEILRRLGKKAGITDNYNPHALRHGAAREMLTKGASLAHVQQLLGHRSIVTTAKFYSAFATDELHTAHDKFGWIDQPEPESDLEIVSDLSPKRDLSSLAGALAEIEPGESRSDIFEPDPEEKPAPEKPNPEKPKPEGYECWY